MEELPERDGVRDKWDNPDSREVPQQVKWTEIQSRCCLYPNIDMFFLPLYVSVTKYGSLFKTKRTSYDCCLHVASELGV